MYLNLSNFWWRTLAGGGGTSLGPKTGTSVGWEGLTKFLLDGGTLPVPLEKNPETHYQIVKMQINIAFRINRTDHTLPHTKFKVHQPTHSLLFFFSVNFIIKNLKTKKVVISQSKICKEIRGPGAWHFVKFSRLIVFFFFFLMKKYSHLIIRPRKKKKKRKEKKKEKENLVKGQMDLPSRVSRSGVFFFFFLFFLFLFLVAKKTL